MSHPSENYFDEQGMPQSYHGNPYNQQPGSAGKGGDRAGGAGNRRNIMSGLDPSSNDFFGDLMTSLKEANQPKENLNNTSFAYNPATGMHEQQMSDGTLSGVSVPILPPIWLRV